jgi:hypothetical protein
MLRWNLTMEKGKAFACFGPKEHKERIFFWNLCSAEIIISLACLSCSEACMQKAARARDNSFFL